MINLLVTVLGRNLAWRLGRAIYMAARGEGANDMQNNGERWLLEALARTASSSTGPAVIVDCGANLGHWSAMAVSIWRTAGVDSVHHLMEPSPASRAALLEAFGGSANVHVHAVALSDRNGKASFHLVSPTGGTNSLVDSAGAPSTSISVDVARGGDYFASLAVDRIALLKIDTEGHDFAVMEGIEEWLLARRIDAVQFEYNHRWLGQHRSMRDVFELAHRVGYRVGRPSASGTELYDRYNPENDRFIEWNYVLLLPEVAARIGARECKWSPANTLLPA
jgi:FkbM family methyltransferase